MPRRYLPILRWLPVSRTKLRADFLAGLTVSLVLVPQAMAYAELAGLPPWIGLYAAFLPTILGSVFGSSNHLQTGPVAMASLLTASTLIGMATPHSAQYMLLAAQLSFIVGILWLIIWALKLNFLANFLSRPVIEGFAHAAELIIASSQLPKLLGVTFPRTDFYLRDLWHALMQLGEANLISAGLGIGALIALLILKPKYPKAPISFFVLVLATLIVYFFGLADPAQVAAPVAIVGAVPEGIPEFVWAVPGWSTAMELLPGAVAITLVSFMEVYGVSKAVAAQSKQRLDLNQEIIGQGVACVSSAFSGAYPVSGSFSRTALNYAAGAMTGVSGVFTGLFVMTFLALFTDLLFFLPLSVLGAIIIHAVLQLMHFKRFLHYLKVDRAEGIAAIVTFVATLAYAPQLELGILFGVFLSIAIYLYRTMKPHVCLLGRHPDGTMRDAEQHGLVVDPDLPTIRFDGDLCFANVSYFEEQVLRTCEEFPEAKYIAIACDGITSIDASGEEILSELVSRLRRSDVQLIFIGLKHQVRQVLRLSGLYKEIGEDHIFFSFDKAYATFPPKSKAEDESQPALSIASMSS